MRQTQINPLDFNQSYPCPVCRQGQLRPIVLTEAMGCDRCQQIFVLKADQTTLEQVSMATATQRTWCWTGRGWYPAGNHEQERIWRIVLGVFFLVIIPLVLAIPILLNTPGRWGIVVLIGLTIILVIIPLILAWFGWDRR